MAIIYLLSASFPGQVITPLHNSCWPKCPCFAISGLIALTPLSLVQSSTDRKGNERTSQHWKMPCRAGRLPGSWVASGSSSSTVPTSRCETLSLPLRVYWQVYVQVVSEQRLIFSWKHGLWLSVADSRSNTSNLYLMLNALKSMLLSGIPLKLLHISVDNTIKAQQTDLHSLTRAQQKRSMGKSGVPLGNGKPSALYLCPESPCKWSTEH